MGINDLLYFVWFLAILGAFVAFQLWQLRQIERETPPRKPADEAQLRS